MNPSISDEQNPDLLEALAHEKNAESQLLFAQAKRARATQRVPEPIPAALTTDELCAALRISKPTVGRLLKDGMPVSHTGSRRRFNLADVQRWQAERGKKAAPKSAPRAVPSEPEVAFDDRELSRMGIRRVG